jgi:tetratricopeptide (TPR) repeat protein
MASWLGRIFTDPEMRAILSWLGGGAVVVAGGIWMVVTFVAEVKDAQDKKGGTAVTVSGQGIASDDETNIHGSVTFDPTNETIAQNHEPLVEQLGQKDAQIATLTTMLLEKNLSAAGPGAQQAVGGAVLSIAQGASEGDKRLQQALGLLKENKTVEAAQLLNAIAEDKTARADQATAQVKRDRKEAAIAYRNLGAITDLRDPKRALGAYEKALALDPDDIDSLFWVGYIQIDHGDLDKAQSRLERVLELAGTGDQAFYKYATLIGLGDIKQRRGELKSALKSYKDSLAIAEHLATSDHGNAEWQHDLSVSYDDVGDIQVAQGDLKGALKSYSDSLAIRERLAKSDPGNAEWQRDLYVSFNKIGDAQEALGDIGDALKSYDEGFAIAERLAKSDPVNALWQYDLGISDERIGDARMAQRDLDTALKFYEAKRDIISRLAISDSGNAEWQRDLSVSYEKIGDVQKAEGDLGGALKSYSDSLAIHERLATSDPGNAVWQRDLSVCYGKVGDVQKAQGNLGDALKSYENDLAIAERLANSDPGNAGWQRNLIVSYKKIADCAPAERRANLTHALEIARALQTSGRLAPADVHMLDELTRWIAELPKK